MDRVACAVKVNCDNRDACFLSLFYAGCKSRAVRALQNDRIVALVDAVCHDLNLRLSGLFRAVGIYLDVGPGSALSLDTLFPALVVGSSDIMSNVSDLNLVACIRINLDLSAASACCSTCRCIVVLSGGRSAASASCKAQSHDCCECECDNSLFHMLPSLK